MDYFLSPTAAGEKAQDHGRGCVMDYPLSPTAAGEKRKTMGEVA